AAVDPVKDVDGLHPVNAGRLLLGGPGMLPSTPAGVLRMLDDYTIEIAGRRAGVLGRSNIVGKPTALLLLRRDATVTICHSKTVGLAEICRQADILVVAIRQLDFVKPGMVRPGAAVIDVGINTRPGGRLGGDVDPGVAGVAGGVAPGPRRRRPRTPARPIAQNWGGGGAGAQTRLTYEAALEYVSSLRRFGVKLGLDRMHAFLDQLGHPERGKRGALIAGTNGKGSTSAFLESILRARGFHTGLTPSPHLSSYTERVQLDAEPISDAAFAAAVTDLRELVAPVVERMGQSTEFEFLIAMAIRWLAPRTDRLVIEIGMGGRLDSTNALDLGVAVITNVTYDHRRHLGRTVRK